jgi:hypothetical protein
MSLNITLTLLHSTGFLQNARYSICTVCVHLIAAIGLYIFKVDKTFINSRLRQSIDGFTKVKDTLQNVMYNGKGKRKEEIVNLCINTIEVNP